MRTRVLGRSGLEITTIGRRRLGDGRRWLVGRLWQPGRPGVDRGDPPRARARRQLDRHRARSTASGTRRRSSAGRSQALAERPLVFTKCSLVRDARGEVVTDLSAASIRDGVRAEPATPGRRCDRPLPDPLARAGHRRLARGGLGDARRAPARGQGAAPRWLELRARPHRPRRRRSRRSSRCSRRTASSSAARRARPPAALPRRRDRRHRLLAHGVGAAHRHVDARASRRAPGGRLAAGRPEVLG